MTQSIAVTRLIDAPASTIFDLLADPAQHAVIDGSGTVRAPRGGAPARLTLGARFGMDMRLGLPYRITNEVVEFEEGRRIGWRHFGGHIWRYELDPADGKTRVTETFDYAKSKGRFIFGPIGQLERNRKAMEQTLERLAVEVEAPRG